MLPLPARKYLSFGKWRAVPASAGVDLADWRDGGVDVAQGCRIVFNRSTCSGVGLCEMHAPDVFEIADDGDGLMTPRTLTVDAEHREMVELAASSCPTASITLVDL